MSLKYLLLMFLILQSIGLGQISSWSLNCPFKYYFYCVLLFSGCVRKTSWMCVLKKGPLWKGVARSESRVTGQKETRAESTSHTEWQKQSSSQTTHKHTDTHAYCMYQLTHSQYRWESEGIFILRRRKTRITEYDLVFINKNYIVN